MKVPIAAQSITLQGWLEIPKRQVSQNFRFYKLRAFLAQDALSTRTLQLVSRHAAESAVAEKLRLLRSESCVQITCRKLLRPEQDRRGKRVAAPSLLLQAETMHRRLQRLPVTEEAQDDDFEYEIENVEVVNARTEELPFLPNQEAEVDTLVRARNRLVEMRSDALGGSLRLRSQIKASLRNTLESEGFLEVETPLLFKSTPEGAREFLVPTRRAGAFFALPQSPQQYKQMLMAGGIHRYYQFARCFRDEDSRADRQLEFTQLDMEMSFAGAEEVMTTVSQMVLGVADAWDQPNLFETKAGEAIPRMTYAEAMARYGSDKPDLTFGLEIWSERVDEDWHGPGEATLLELVSVPTPLRGTTISSRALKTLQETLARDAPGVYALKVAKGTLRLPDALLHLQEQIQTHLQAQDCCLVLVHARPVPLSGGATRMGTARLLLQSWLEQHNLTDTPRWSQTQGSLSDRPPLKLLWVTDFPLFSPLEQGEVGQAGTRGLCSTHHPFTAPFPDDAVQLLSCTAEASISSLLAMRGQHYDLVMNGCEIGGGSVRIHDPSLQQRLFDTLGMPSAKRQGFTHLLRALGSGCPPHAGFALGLDRFLSLLLGKASIREVIAFPKTSGGLDPLVQAPSTVDAETLRRDHHLEVVHQRK